MSTPHPVRWLREHPRAADGLLAVVVTATAVVAHVVGDAKADQSDVIDPTWWSTILAALTAAPIAWRRVRPLETGLVVVAAQVVALAAGVWGAAFAGSGIAIYSIGAHAAGRARTRVLIAITAMIVLLFVAGWIDGQALVDEFVSTAVVLVTAFVVGDNMRRRRQHVDALAERAERAEREQELVAEHRVSAERTRIARELHDVVAHSVSVMVIQAAAARRNLDAAPDRARAALTNIEQTGRATMVELRGLLGVLRDHREPSTDLAPQPTLDDLSRLVAADHDLPIRLQVDGEVHDLPPGVTLTAYRLLQEALTNVRRHAGSVEHVDVRMRRSCDRLDLAVTDDGRGAAADHGTPGYGIVGMRERVSALGGVMEAGPHRGGGWRVAVSLPLGPGATLGRPA